MEKVYGFLLAAVLTNIFVVFFAGNIYPTSAKIVRENSPIYLQDNSQKTSVKLQALQGETEPQSSETVPSSPEQQEQQQQELEQREQKLDRELDMGSENPEAPTGEEVPGPEEQLKPESIDDNFPFQPPDEEIEFNSK